MSNILQKIINAPSTVKFNTDEVPNISEPIKDTLIEDNNDIEYKFLNPSNQDIMDNIPQTSLNVLILDISLFLYAYLLKIKQFFEDAWDGLIYVITYRAEIKTAKTLAKEHKIKQKNFISNQVCAMVPVIARFNNCNSCWAEGVSGDTVYQVRNQHKTVKNRNIARHWAVNTKQAVS